MKIIEEYCRNQMKHSLKGTHAVDVHQIVFYFQAMLTTLLRYFFSSSVTRQVVISNKVPGVLQCFQRRWIVYNLRKILRFDLYSYKLELF